MLINRIYDLLKLVKKEQIKNILGLGSSNTENSNDNGFCSYMQIHIYHIMQRIAQLLHGIQKLQTIKNIKTNFNHQQVITSRGKYKHNKNILRLQTFKTFKDLLGLTKMYKGTR